MRRNNGILAIIAIAIAGTALAATGGRLGFGGSHPSRATFPNEITCAATNHCTPGRSADGQALRLLKVVDSAKSIHIVGVGADTGDGRQLTPLVCTASIDGIRCGTQLPAGERRLGLYLPG